MTFRRGVSCYIHFSVFGASCQAKLCFFFLTVDVRYAYHHFAEGEAPSPPFLCFLFPYSDNFAADGRVYLKISSVHIELYTDEKSPSTEELLESVLNAYGIFYDKSEIWIESEQLYEVLYSFETEELNAE